MEHQTKNKISDFIKKKEKYFRQTLAAQLQTAFGILPRGSS
jgi:hypothetical protein